MQCCFKPSLLLSFFHKWGFGWERPNQANSNTEELMKGEANHSWAFHDPELGTELSGTPATPSNNSFQFKLVWLLRAELTWSKYKKKKKKFFIYLSWVVSPSLMILTPLLMTSSLLTLLMSLWLLIELQSYPINHSFFHCSPLLSTMLYLYICEIYFSYSLSASVPFPVQIQLLRVQIMCSLLYVLA